MTEKNITLSSVEDIKNLVTIAELCDFSIDIGKNINNSLDAKSLLGIMALGLNTRLKLFYNGENILLENFIRSHQVCSSALS